MKPDEYVRLASTTRSGTNQNLDHSFMDNIHMMLGIMSEAGELADAFRKNLSYQTPIDWINIKEELGDLILYVAGFCDINGFSLEEVMETNIEKLKTRFPEGFNEYDATHRDLDIERNILEVEQEDFYCLTKNDMLTILNALCDTETAPFCPSCKKIDGHTDVCELVESTGIVVNLLNQKQI